MRKPFLAATMCLGLCSLAGCTTVDNSIGLGHRTPPPSITGAFDGSYFGPAELVRRSPGAGCPDDRKGVAEVGDKRLSFAYAPLVIFNPPIQPDGTFHETVGQSVLDGQIKNDRLKMRVRTPLCDSDYNLTFIGNHS